MRSVTFDKVADGPANVYLDGSKVGSVRKPNFGPGFFLTLDGKTWKNAAPGARIQQERDFVAKETYCKTLKVAKERVLQNIPE